MYEYSEYVRNTSQRCLVVGALSSLQAVRNMFTNPKRQVVQ